MKRILQGEGVPPFCKHAGEVAERTLDLEGNSIELARTILKDLGLTSQVLRVANSALYNRSGRPILSVAHAIMLLGWDTVRSLVSTVRFIEHFADRSPGVRELMLLSVLAAVQSRDIAASVGYPQPEEAYICGLFRNLGEVLVACYYPREYSQIVLAMHTEKIPVRAACLRVLDFAWDDVGSRVATGWNMPGKVRVSLSGASSGSALDRSLASIAEYTRDLTRALYRDGAVVDSFHLRCVTDPEGRQTLVSVRDLRRIVDGGVNETRDTFAALGIPTQRLRLEQQAERARYILESVSPFDAAGLREMDQAIDQAARTIRQRDFALSSFIGVVLDEIRSAGFDRAVFGLVNENHTAIRGRLASAESVEDVLDRFRFPIDRAEGPILAALQRKNDLLVDRARDGRYDASGLVAALEPAAFALFPIVIDGKTAGCLYADRRSPAPGLEAVRGPIGRARDALAQAIRKVAPQSHSS